MKIKHFCIFLIACYVFLFPFTVPLPSHAVGYYWVGESGSWDDPANWSLGPTGPGGAGVPGHPDVPIITPTDSLNRTIYYPVDFDESYLGGLRLASEGTGVLTSTLR